MKYSKLTWDAVLRVLGEDGGMMSNRDIAEAIGAELGRVMPLTLIMWEAGVIDRVALIKGHKTAGPILYFLREKQ